MTSLPILLLVLSTLVVAQFGPAGIPPWGHSFALVLTLIVSAGLGLAGNIGYALVARKGLSSANLLMLSRVERLRLAIGRLWLVTYPMVLTATGWLSWACSFGKKGDIGIATLVLLFLPYLLHSSLAELGVLRRERLLSQSEAPISGRDWMTRIRLGQTGNLLLCLLPIFLMTLTGQLARYGLGQDAAPVLTLATLCLSLLGFLIVFPAVLGSWYGAQPMSDSRRAERFQRILCKVDLPRLRIREIPLASRWNGAAVVGWFPATRQLWIGGALLQSLDDRECEMVLLHELAHVKRRHWWWRLLPMFWALLAGLVCNCLEQSSVIIPMDSTVFSLCSMGISIGVLIGGLAIVSRACELDADETACRLADEVCEWAQRNPGASEAVLAQALSTVLADPRHARSSWLHPSLKERLSNLAKSLADRRASESLGMDGWQMGNVR